jgi:hypothetical protein
VSKRDETLSKCLKHARELEALGMSMAELADHILHLTPTSAAEAAEELSWRTGGAMTF